MPIFIDPDLIERHYGVALFKGYVLLLRNKLGPTESKKFFEKTGLPEFYFDNQTNYVSEKWVDDFYNNLKKLTDFNTTYIDESAQLSISKEALGYLSLMVVRFLPVSAFMKQSIEFAKKLNKVDNYEIVAISDSSLIFKFSSRRKSPHLDLIVLGWKSYLELAPTLREQQRGDCIIEKNNGEYILKVSWKSSNIISETFRNSILYIWLFISFGMQIFVSYSSFKIINSINILFASLYIYSLLKQNNTAKIKEMEQTKIVENIVSNADQKYDELIIEKKKVDRRYKETRLLNTVIQRIGLAKSSQDLIDLTISELKTSLSYDRVVYMSSVNNYLKVTGHIGFHGKIQKMIDTYQIDLTEVTNEHLHLGNVFKRKDHILIPITDLYLSKLSEGAKSLLTFSGSRSFLMCTVSTNVNSHGVIMIDYVTDEKQLNDDDLHLVKNLSNQLAIYLDQVLAVENEANLRTCFQKFVPSNLVDTISKSGLEEIKPRKTRVSILFSDIRGFTKRSLQAPPETVTKALNIYFSEVNKIIYDLGGVVDKFLGDGILAVFNAFDDCQEHELAATQAAQKIQLRMNYIRIQIKNETKMDINWSNWEIGIAVHTGEVIVGLIGTNEKLEFTVLGDAVNVASRLCEVAKDYDNPIIISPEIQSKLTNDFQTIPLPEITIRGHGRNISPFLISTNFEIKVA